MLLIVSLFSRFFKHIIRPAAPIARPCRPDPYNLETGPTIALTESKASISLYTTPADPTVIQRNTITNFQSAVDLNAPSMTPNSSAADVSKAVRQENMANDTIAMAVTQDGPISSARSAYHSNTEVPGIYARTPCTITFSQISTAAVSIPGKTAYMTARCNSTTDLAKAFGPVRLAKVSTAETISPTGQTTSTRTAPVIAAAAGLGIYTLENNISAEASVSPASESDVSKAVRQARLANETKFVAHSSNALKTSTASKTEPGALPSHKQVVGRLPPGIGSSPLREDVVTAVRQAKFRKFRMANKASAVISTPQIIEWSSDKVPPLNSLQGRPQQRRSPLPASRLALLPPLNAPRQSGGNPTKPCS